ncbi:sulfite exporter TauE/SafE family protein [Agrobacterium vitis]|uniref:Probable membrane transporter protein n=1 Tax=Agrobacterium vitis TaxID=373 RepID=A0AAE2RG57_AGRVI|nr:sulfite exporter TauE/SafE family protein [Agrobacterium vitis]MBF2716130.1 sulfite exporter TauE/SafE family protein [Agrobacterium vitis]MUZ64709.1 TSUP family transporter [Agrobacterium vitis]MVA20791.1 TSUP family transporter [Agrobacterium vitis]
MSLSGFVVGCLVGITGVGGASLMTPLMVLLFGVHPATAVGTDLLYAAVTKMAGAAVHHRHGHIRWRLVGLLALGSVPATGLTLWLMSGVDRKSAHSVDLLTTSLGIMLMMTAMILLFRDLLVRYEMNWLKSHRSPSPRAIAIGTFVLGLVLGAVVTLTSVGAGAIGVTVLLFLYPRSTINDIVGSDIAHAIPLTLIGGIGYWVIGDVNWVLLGSLLIGSIPGIVLGSYAAPRLPEKAVRIILALILVIVAAKLISL